MGHPELQWNHRRNLGNIQQIGHKLKQGVEFGLALKGIYDIGKTLYAAAQILAPILLAGL
jgi:hypothetical protein